MTVAVNLFSYDGLVMALAAFTLLGFWLVLYKENMWHRIVENLLVGGSIANILVIGVGTIRDQAGLLTAGNYALIIPMILGVMLFLNFLPQKYKYFSFWSTAVMLGVGLGYALKQSINSDGARQILGAIQKSVIAPDAFTTLSNIYMVAATFAGIFYFIFTLEPKGPMRSVTRGITRFGRIAMMGAFGALFGSTMISRWGSGITAFDPYMIVGWGPYLMAVAGLWIAADMVLSRRKKVVEKIARL